MVEAVLICMLIDFHAITSERSSFMKIASLKSSPCIPESGSIATLPLCCTLLKKTREQMHRHTNQVTYT